MNLVTLKSAEGNLKEAEHLIMNLTMDTNLEPHLKALTDTLHDAKMFTWRAMDALADAARVAGAE